MTHVRMDTRVASCVKHRLVHAWWPRACYAHVGSLIIIAIRFCYDYSIVHQTFTGRAVIVWGMFGRVPRRTFLEVGDGFEFVGIYWCRALPQVGYVMQP